MVRSSSTWGSYGSVQPLSHLSNSNVSALGIRWTTGCLARPPCQGCEAFLYLLELLSNLVADMFEMFSVFRPPLSHRYGIALCFEFRMQPSVLATSWDDRHLKLGRSMFHKGISRYFVRLCPTDMGLHFASNSVCSPQSLQPRGMTVTLKLGM